MMHAFDVVVIGAGPAGLASAIALAEAGIDVLVCDQRAVPTDKACGEGIMPTGVAELRRLDVEHLIARERCHPIAGVRYIVPSGREVASEFAEGAGLGVRRVELSRALLARAWRLPHLTLRAPARVSGCEFSQSGLAIAVDGEAMAPRLIVGADGLHSRVRRWAGLTKRSGGPRRWGIRRHFAVAPWSDHVEVHFSPGVEAYVTPVGAAEVGVALLWDRDRAGGVSGGARLFNDLLDRFPALQRRLPEGATSSTARATGPLLQPTHGTVTDGVVLVGDAAGYVDALTGEGISLALQQARALRTTVVPLLGKRDQTVLGRRALAPYARRVASLTRPYRLMTRALLRIGRSPWLVEWLVAGLSREPRLFQHLLSTNMGRVPLPLRPAVLDWLDPHRSTGIRLPIR